MTKETEDQNDYDKDVMSDRSATDVDNDGGNTDNILTPEKPSGDIKETAEAATVQDHEYITGIKLLLVLTSVTLVAFLMLLDVAIIATAIPRITSDFHSLPDVGWYGSAYLLASCAFQPLTGKMYSEFNTKFTFLGFLTLFEVGSAISGGARNSAMLIIGRAIAGLGSSGLINGALTIIAASIPLIKRPLMLGIVMSISQIGIVTGPLIGGALTEYASWRWCFFINLPIGAVAAVFLLLITIPDHNLKGSTRVEATLLARLGKLDLFGFLLFAPSAIMILMALQWGGWKYPWNSATIIGLFCGGFAMAIVFLGWEYRVGDKAMVPFSMVRLKIMWASSLSNFFFYGNLLIFSYYLPIYFQSVKGESPTMSGVYTLPSIVSQLIASIVSGGLIGRVGYYLPFIVTSGVLSAISSGLVATFTPSTSVGKWVGYQIISGTGRGFGMQIAIVAIQNILPPDKIPVGMSILVFAQIFGGAVILSIAQTIFSGGLLSGLARFAPTTVAADVVNAGATAIKDVVEPGEVAGVIEAYNMAINRTFYLAAGSAVGLFVFSCNMGWVDIRKKKTVSPEA